MGIMVHLFTPLLLAPIQYIMSPLSFLKKPILWLELMSKYKGEFSGAPNFAYALLANKYGHLVNDPTYASLDLSSWKVAYCGAEPIRSTTITAFCNTFAKWKFPSKCFCPCYGLAEATLLVTFSRADRDATMMKISRYVSYISELKSS
jgi:acyl-CoA synthetase (AMP-forming)/AMP-acid ligase II